MKLDDKDNRNPILIVGYYDKEKNDADYNELSVGKFINGKLEIINNYYDDVADKIYELLTAQEKHA